MSPREETVLKAMVTLAPIGALVPIASIHKAIGRAGKRFTDQALLSLAEEGIIALHVHDWPQGASRDERKYMLKANYGGKLYYFIGAAIREDQVSKVKKIIGQKNPRYLVTAKQKTVRDVDLGVLEDKSAAKALTRAKSLYAGKGYTGMKAKRRNPVLTGAEIDALPFLQRNRVQNLMMGYRLSGEPVPPVVLNADGTVSLGPYTLDRKGQSPKAPKPPKSSAPKIEKPKTPKVKQERFRAVALPIGPLSSSDIELLPAMQQAKIEYYKRSARLSGGKIYEIRYNADKTVTITGENSPEAGSRQFTATYDSKGNLKNPARRRNKTIIKAGRIDHLDVAKVHNPGKPKMLFKVTGIGENGLYYYNILPSRAKASAWAKKHGLTNVSIVRLNPSSDSSKTTRRKYRNGYIDLVIKGSAKKTAQGWKVGKKTIPQGRGIVNVSSGYYLDKATGMVFAKRARNPRNVAQGFFDGNGVFHPIRSSADYDGGKAGETGKKPIRTRSKKRKASLKKASQTARLKAETKRRKSTASRLASRSLSRSAGILKGSGSQRQKRRNPTPAENRREFAGRYSGNKDLFFPEGTPAGLSKLGTLKLIKAEAGSIKPTKGTVWLCRDQAGKLHIGTTKANAVLFSGSAQSLGKIKVLEYDEAKPHLGEPRTVRWFHKMGEETGERPTLYADGKGGLKIRGGAYRIESRGIVN